MDFLLDVINNKKNKIFFEILTEVLENKKNIEVFLSYASQIKKLLPVLKSDINSTNYEKIEKVLFAIRSIDDNLKLLSDILPSGESTNQLKSKIKERLIQNLTPTEIYISKIGAKEGERLIITIENKFRTGVVNNNDEDSFRSSITEVVLIIKDLGWIRRVSDSFLFIKRLNIEEEDYGTNEEIVTPREVNFEPTAGVTLSWTHYNRKDGTNWNNIMRWLEPSIGINVSFPRFGSVITSFESSSTNSDVRKVNVTESNEKIDVGAGFILGFFDNAIQFTYGWNLTVSEKRSYFGIGFSFLNLARKVSP